MPRKKNSQPGSLPPINPDWQAKVDKIEQESEQLTRPVEPEPTGFVQRAGAEEAKPAKRRLSIGLKDDGTLDIESMRGKTRTEVREFLSNPDNFAALGIAVQPQSEESLFKFTEKDAESALNFLNGSNAWATAFFLKRFKGFEIHPQVLERAFVIPEPQKQDLKERGARLMNRYSSEWMRRHADLVFFVLGYLDVVKLQALTAITMQSQINQAANAARAGQQPGPKPGIAGANGAEAAEGQAMV